MSALVPGWGWTGEAVRRRAARLEALTRGIFEHAIARGTLRAQDVHAASLAIFRGSERLVYAFLEGDPTLDPTTLPGEVTRLFRQGLAPWGSRAGATIGCSAGTIRSVAIPVGAPVKRRRAALRA